MAKRIVVCKNKRLKIRKTVIDLRRSDLDAGCMGCYFMASHQGKYWTDDWARCTAPIKVKYGDKLEVTKAVSEKVKRVGELKPVGESI